MISSARLWMLFIRPTQAIFNDSTKPKTFSLLVGDRKTNLIITDLFYNVDYEGSDRRSRTATVQTMLSTSSFLLATFQNTKLIMVDDASICVFHVSTEGLNFH